LKNREKQAGWVESELMFETGYSESTNASTDQFLRGNDDRQKEHGESLIEG